MADWLDDLKVVIVAAGVPAASIYLSSSAAIPTSGGPYLSIIETGGRPSDRTHNAAGDAYHRPGAQLIARGPQYQQARNMLKTAYNACTVINNQQVNGTWYLAIRPLQNLNDLSPDSNGRARIAFNVLGYKRPS
jgi:hypothetical protein